MKEWKLSHYTSIVRCESGDILLHNSFMGAIARIPSHYSNGIEKIFQQGIKEYDISNQVFKELCDGGFFVLFDLDERKLVSQILDQERESGFSMIILPHENCNFRCLYCYEKYERGKMNQDIIVGLKALVAKKVEECKSLAVCWFGGEPLLAQDIVYELSESFIDSCSQNNIPYTSSIITNGYLLTPHVVSSLLQRKVKRFQVTLDGYKTIHDSMRKLKGEGGTYEKILNNLKHMSNRSEEFSVRIRVNFNDDSISLMEQFFSEISSLFASDPRFVLNFKPIGKWGGPNDSTLNVCNPESAWVTQLELIERSLKFGFSDQIIKESLMSHGNVCYASKESTLVVRSDGMICKCTLAFEDPRNHVGKLTKEGKLLIDQSLWNLWTKLDDKDISGCVSCLFSPSCQSRMCPLVAMDQKKPPCPMTKTEYESMVKLVALGRMN